MEETEATLASGETAYDGLERLIVGLEQRHDDGWLAVFFEFWAHVLRHAELRERLAEQRRRGMMPLIGALERIAAERDERLPEEAMELAVARCAAQTGVQLERLTRPDLVDLRFSMRMLRLTMDGERTR